MTDPLSKEPNMFYTHTLSSSTSVVAQQILKPDFHVDYPLLMHTTYHPKKNKLLVCNLAMNEPKKLIDLGDYRFVKFVETSFTCESTHPNIV